MPEGWVRELAYAGRRLDAAKAKEIGLVNEVFETQDAMLAQVMELAGEIAAKSPVAVAGSKRMINYARDHSTDAALDYIATWQSGMFAPEHMMEAFQAKGQKRAPNFPDLAPLRKKL
jgi:enoyl-CoA hydratase